jgi:large subunit ribosomal protein L25
MANKITLSVAPREITGKKVKHLRRDGLLVGNVYGLGSSTALQAPAKTLLKTYHEVGESTVIYLQIGDAAQTQAVLFDELQRDPVTGEVLHFSLRAVDLKEKITTFIAIETIGELAAKEAVALLTHQEVEVEALPTDLPEGFTIDLSKLENIGAEVTFADLDYNHDKVTLLVDDLSAPVLVVNAVEEEVPEEEPAPEAAPDAATPAAPDQAAPAADTPTSAPEETKKDN